MPDSFDSANLELGPLISGLGGGLALFLFGMRQMTEGLKTVAGNSMKNLLAKLTANRFTAAIAGALVTAVIQSSSVTTVLVVGFISAGLLTLSQSIGVIIGANVGTTITAQIIAFQVYKYGLLMIAIGFFVDITAKNESLKQWGMAGMGLGLIFFGMELMSGATGPLRSWPPFMHQLQNLHTPLLAIAIGAAFTAVVQSSTTTTGIVIVLASQGLISLEAGIGLCFGANIGTCVTAIASTIGRPRAAVQAAGVHVVFNVGGVLLWMFFIPEFAELVRSFSPTSRGLSAAETLARDAPRQIANAHTLFNIANAMLFIWLTGPLAKLMDWLVPMRVEPLGIQPKFIDAIYLEQPALALDQVRRELVRLAELTDKMIRRSLNVAAMGSRLNIANLESADDDIDTLYDSIVTYLGKLSQQDLVTPQPKQLRGMLGIANYLENIGDVIKNEMVVDAKSRIRKGVTISPATVEVLRPIHKKVCWTFERAMESLDKNDAAAAQEAVDSKPELNRLSETATSHLAKRLVAYEPNRLAAFKLETGIITNLHRINTLSRRIAGIVLEIENGNALPDETKESEEHDSSGDS